MLARMWRKRNPSTLLVGMQTGAASVENSMELPQKIKNGNTLWLSNSTSGNLFRETQNTNLKDYTPMLIAVLFTITNIWRQPKCSPDEWIKNCGTFTQWNLLLNLTLCDSMKQPGEHYVKWNRPVRQRQVPYDFTHMWNLVNKMNSPEE